jgi:hypothetical protein
MELFRSEEMHLMQVGAAMDCNAAFLRTAAHPSHPLARPP